MQERNRVFYSNKKLKDQNIVIREELTKFNYEIVADSKEKNEIVCKK